MGGSLIVKVSGNSTQGWESRTNSHPLVIPKLTARWKWRTRNYSRSSRLGWTRGAWSEELPNVLWAYRTTARTLIGETLFSLTYGTETIIPVEVGIASLRWEAFHEGSNDNKLRVNLDYLDKARDRASHKMAEYQQKMSEYYNKRVNLNQLNIGDLVLCKVTPITKDPTQGKLSPTWEGLYKVTYYSRQGSYHLETLDWRKLP